MIELPQALEERTKTASESHYKLMPRLKAFCSREVLHNYIQKVSTGAQNDLKNLSATYLEHPVCLRRTQSIPKRVVKAISVHV